MHKTVFAGRSGCQVFFGNRAARLANVRVFLHGEDGFFAFNLSPAQARALAASVDRHCPDAETMPLILPEDEYALVRRDIHKLTTQPQRAGDRA